MSDRFEQKLRYIHDLMLERGRITAEEHAIYAAMPLEFDLLERGDPQACLDEIDALLEGSQTQRALSGLLGDEDQPEAPIGWIDDKVETGLSWGVRPPLPDWSEFVGVPTNGALVDPDALEPIGGGPRLEPREGSDEAWRVPQQVIDRDPANSDAPGHPAMDEPLDIG